jgi:hypothetical protein
MTTPHTPLPGETPGDGTLPGETPNNTPGTGETPPTPPLSIDDAQKEIDRLTASLKRANAEAKTSREKATELDTLKKQIEDAKLSEKERLEKELAAAQKQLAETTLVAQEARSTAALEKAARAAGIADAVALDDAVRIGLPDLTLDAEGKPTNAKEVMDKVLKVRPWLLTQQRGTVPGARPGPRPQGQAGEPNQQDLVKSMQRSGKYGF